MWIYRDSEGLTAAQIAFEFGDMEIVRLCSGWTRETHHNFPRKFRQKVLAFLLLFGNDYSRLMIRLPEDMVDMILAAQVCGLDAKELVSSNTSDSV